MLTTTRYSNGVATGTKKIEETMRRSSRAGPHACAVAHACQAENSSSGKGSRETRLQGSFMEQLQMTSHAVKVGCRHQEI